MSDDRPFPPDEHRTVRRSPARRRNRVLVLVAFCILIAAGAAVLFTVLPRLGGQDGSVTGGTGEVREVVVPPGLSAQNVAELLEQQGIVGSATAFLVDVRLAGAAEDLRPGTYRFSIGQDHDSVIDALRKGGAVPTIDVTLPEGLSIDQAAERLSEGGLVDGEEYESLAREPQAFALPEPGGRPLQPIPADLEGLLFPDTYRLTESEGARDLITLQLGAFADQAADLPWDRAGDLGLTPYEVITVASLIEKEVRIPEERRLVSSVIHNRLEQGMPLGIDATIRFALKKWTEPLTKSDLAVESPYNTRSIEGLPPAPIASPGRAALEAALDPEETDYLYYVLQDDEGHHFFTASYEEFLQAKERMPAQD